MPQRKLPSIKFTWTPELAYATGLLVTDGNLSKDGRHIAFRSSEIQLVETYKRCMNINNSVTKTVNNGFSRKNSYVVQHGGVQLHQWLVSIGITPAKTYTVGQIKIPKKFFRDFLRGHLDGDGYIQRYTDNYNVYKGRRYTASRLYSRFISASEIHIRWLYKMIRACLPLKGAILLKKPFTSNRVPIWEIRFAKSDSLKLLRWLYYKDKLPTLERKREVAEKALQELSK